MIRTWSVGASIGGVVLAAVLLSGCGSADDDAAAFPSSTVPASGTPSAEPSPGATPADYVPASLDGPAQNVPKPVLPELAKEESLAGAQAFLDYWSDAMWYAYQTGDTSYARDIISPACEACMAELNEVASVYTDGGWMTGGRPTINLTEASLVEAHDGVYKPQATYGNEGGKLIEDGAVVHEANPSSDESTLVYMDYVDRQWVYITMAPVAGE